MRDCSRLPLAGFGCIALLLFVAIALPVYRLSATGQAQPSWGTPIAVSTAGGVVWVVNPDAGSITAVDPTLNRPSSEIVVGGEPWSVAPAPDGQAVYVVDRAGGRLVTVDPVERRVVAEVEVGPEPGHVALSPSGAAAYVTVTGADELAVVETASLRVARRLPLEARPYAIAVTNDGDSDDGDESIYVTHSQAFARPAGREATDDGREGRVTVVDAGQAAGREALVLAPASQGFPNLLTGISLGAGRAWISHQQTSPDLPNDFDTMVFAAVSAIDLGNPSGQATRTIQLNDEDIFGSAVNLPVAAVASPAGDRLYVVAAGSDLIVVIDVRDLDNPQLIGFLPAGHNPRGIALSPDGRRAYVMSYLSRAVTVLDLDRLQRLAEIPVTSETLAPDVLRGKQLFNNAVDPKLTKRFWISCATCHPDGGTDGVTWRFPDGPRQTPPLWNASRTLPWHWSAALDELQDVEDTVQTIQHGIGLAPGADPALLGSPNAGRSADLDALAAYLERDIRPAAVPIAAPSDDLERGRRLFAAQGCAQCHGGPEWTVSALPGPAGSLDPDGNGMVDAALRDVGTAHLLDTRGETGFDPPSLLGVGRTAPYLHDGSLPTLEDLIASGHPKSLVPAGEEATPVPALPSQVFMPSISRRTALSEADVRALAVFLRSIGPSTPPVQLSINRTGEMVQ